MSIDVVIPTYKPDDYFYECLKSLEYQDFSFDGFRVCIVLNGSEEKYLFKIKKWLEDFNFKYSIFFIEEPGVSNARNYALDHIQGEYICFLDDDDIISPNFLKKLYETCPEDGISVSNFYAFKNNITNLERYFMTFDHPFVVKVGWKHRQSFSSVCGKMIPRKIILNYRFDKNITHGEDSILMFLLSKNIKEIRSTDVNCIYYRRVRGNSATTVRKSMFFYINNFINQIYYFSKIYFNSVRRYSFLLFFSRILGAVKNLYLNLFKL